MEVQALPIRDDVTPNLPTQKLTIKRSWDQDGNNDAEMPETR
jgi:hypothetical protein